jgi:hypothetical protein
MPSKVRRGKLGRFIIWLGGNRPTVFQFNVDIAHRMPGLAMNDKRVLHLDVRAAAVQAVNRLPV